jgi:LPXTG-motif cell wall-anchored protein
MFNVRRFSPRLLAVLSLAGLGLAGFVATAAPASAHTTNGSRDCGSVTVTFTDFKKSSLEDLNQVHVTVKTDGGRAVVNNDVVSFANASWSRTYDNLPSTLGTLHVSTWWDHTGSDNETGKRDFTLAAPKDCNSGPECQQRGRFSFTFDGPNGAASVTLKGKNPLCKPVTVLLASFKTEGPTWETSGHQTVFDQVSQVIEAPGTYQLKVKVPDCFTQVDLYVTDKKAVDFDFPNDSLGKYLASNFWPRTDTENGKGTSAWNGGTKGCVVETVPPTTPTSPPATPTTVAPTTSAAPPAVTPGTSLPNTGSSPLPKVLFALVLLGLGTGLVFLGRRRRGMITG